MEQRVAGSGNSTLTPLRRPAQAPPQRLFDGLLLASAAGPALSAQADETPLGGGTLWQVRSSPQRIEGGRRTTLGAPAPPVKLLVQLEGSAQVRQGGRAVELQGSMFTLLDGAQPFSIDMPLEHRQLLVQLPRAAVVARFRGIERRTALPLGIGDPADALVFGFVCSLASQARALSPLAGAHALAALVEMLGAVTALQNGDRRESLVHQARAIIELELADESLSPETLAARFRVSRRHLDSLFKRSGASVSACIWERRLSKAAAQLRDPARQRAGVSEICFESGFKDPAHFARAFRRQFGAAPSIYRSNWWLASGVQGQP